VINHSTYKPLFSTREAASALSVSETTVRRLAKAHFLEQRYIGNRMLITASSIEMFVANLPALPDADWWD
jgi:excisionase family DNA binding protein